MNCNYNKAVHLELIQGVINRMGNNSFLCKGWAVTIFSALSALFLNSIDAHVSGFVISIFGCVSTIMLIIFWYLDSWYLRMERLFRCLFDHVRMEKYVPADPYDMSIKPFLRNVQSVLRIMFSCSILPIYLLLVFVTLFMTFTALKTSGLLDCILGI